MTDPKNTEDQELSLDQLKDAAGGICFEDRNSSDTDTNDTCLTLRQNINTGANDDVLKKNAESLRSDNRF